VHTDTERRHRENAISFVRLDCFPLLSTRHKAAWLMEKTTKKERKREEHRREEIMGRGGGKNLS